MNRFFFLLLALQSSCAHHQNYPQPNKIPHELSIHGETRIDNYFWLNNRENPKVLTHLKAENAHTEKALRPVKKLESQIFSELKGRIKEDESTAPVKDGAYFYSRRFEIGQQYPLYVRKKQETAAPEEILIDTPELAKGHSFFDTSGPRLSPNQQLMAYAVDTVGRRFYTVYFKNLKTGQLLSHKIENVTGNIVWAQDNETLFYTQQNPETLRPEKVFRYNLKTNKNDLVYFEKDEAFTVSIYQSLAKKFIFINSSATLSSEIRYLPADKPQESFQVFWPREPHHEYTVEDGGDLFFIVTNKNAQNFKLMTTKQGQTNLKYWHEVIPSRADTLLVGVTVFQEFMALEERNKGLSQIRLTNRRGQESYKMTFTDPSYVVAVGDNREYTSEWLRYDYQSLRAPNSVFEINFRTKKQLLKKSTEIPHYDPDLYKTERVFITARDGTKVPVSLIMKKDLKQDSTSPLLIYGYGAYGLNLDPWFDSDIFSLLDRGFVYAQAQIRGGSDLGRQWYEQGRTKNKMNTFYDFIDVTTGLINRGYADPKKVFAMGGSAGGLLMGAIINLKPDLFKGVVAQVPFVDVITTMLDENIPLTTSEYDEWGNPHVKADYDIIRKYSPYDNIKRQAFPNILATTGLHDSQVQYWEPAKWVAKLRDHNQANSMILLKTDMEAGHGGASGRFNQLKDTATEYAFILMHTNNW